MTWRDYLPTTRERGSYQGPLSTYAEYHAIGVGFLAGPRYAGLLVAYAALRCSRCALDGHLRDAVSELGYAAVGLTLRIAVETITND